MSSWLPVLPLFLLACGGTTTDDSGATPSDDSGPTDDTPDSWTRDTAPDTAGDTASGGDDTGDTPSTRQRPHDRPPNVLVILMDDVGADKVSSYLGDFAPHGYAPTLLPATPVIDELGAAGVRFTHAWANPHCSPTRAALHTGEHPFRTGVGAPIPPSPELGVDVPTLAQVLAPSHRSAVFGKWHLGSSGAAGDEDRTIDFANEADGHTVADPGAWQHTANPLVHGFERFAGGLESGLCINVGAGGCVGTYTDWVQLYADVSETTQDDAGEPRPLTQAWRESTFATEEVVNRTLDWVASVGDETPWFASVNFHAAHTPAEDHTAFGCTTSTTSAEDRLTQPGMTRTMVECMDTWIGTLLGGLDALDALDGTLIILAGDNGTPDFAGEGPFNTEGRGKASTYESGVRVPFVVADGGALRERKHGRASRAPAVIGEPGRTEDRPVHTTDLFATVAHVAGMEVVSGGQDSVSFLDILRDPDAEPVERFVYAETFQEKSGVQSGWAALRDRHGMKLIAKVLPYADVPGTACHGLQLYDVVSDPLELVDLLGDPAHAGAQQALEDGLAALAADGATWLELSTPCP